MGNTTNPPGERADKLTLIWSEICTHTRHRDGRTQGVSVTELAARSGLSRPTITSLLTDLASMGLVESAKPATRSQLGRPAAAWKISHSPGFVIALDALVQTALVAVVTIDGKVVHAAECELAQTLPQRVNEIAFLIKDCVTQFAHLGRLLHVSISTTGVIDEDGSIFQSDLVPELNGLNLAGEIKQRIGTAVAVNDDINMAAYGEFCTQRDRQQLDPAGDLLYVQLARGIHTGLIIGGKVRCARNYTAGEVSDVLDLRVDDLESLSPRWIARVAQTIASVATVIEPDLIVVSSVPAHPTGTVEEVIRQVRTYESATATVPRAAKRLTVKIAHLGRAAAVIGASYVALNRAHRQLFGADSNCSVVLNNSELIGSFLKKGEHITLTRTTDPLETLKVGVVGCGARAPVALAAERPENGGVISVVCEPHPEAAARVERQLARNPKTVTITATVNEMVHAGVDVAFVTSPDDTHTDVTCELLEAGIAVYLEKPLAITMEGANAILQTAYRTGTKLYVGHNMRHMNVVRTMRQLIRDGRIGQVKAIWCRHFVGSGGDFYFKDWHAERVHSTGLLLQKAAHDIDVMHWLADSHTREVVAMGGLTVYDQVADRADHSHELMRDWFSLDNWPALSQTGLNPVIDVEDLSMMLMHLDNDVYVSYQQCHYTPDYWRNYTVIGTEGRLENFGDGAGGHIKLWNKRTHYQPDGDEVFPIIGDVNGHGDADVLTVTEFMRFVREGTPTDTNPLSAWYAVAAGIKATESLRDHSTPRTVTQPPAEIINYFTNHQTR